MKRSERVECPAWVRVTTVLTVYGIETSVVPKYLHIVIEVTTVLTVYGIETFGPFDPEEIAYYQKLQQYLPFTVLKRA